MIGGIDRDDQRFHVPSIRYKMYVAQAPHTFKWFEQGVVERSSIERRSRLASFSRWAMSILSQRGRHKRRPRRIINNGREQPAAPLAARHTTEQLNEAIARLEASSEMRSVQIIQNRACHDPSQAELAEVIGNQATDFDLRVPAAGKGLVVGVDRPETRGADGELAKRLLDGQIAREQIVDIGFVLIEIGREAGVLDECQAAERPPPNAPPLAGTVYCRL